MRCPHCTLVVPVLASRCPHCTGSIDPFKNMEREAKGYLLLIAIVVVIFILMASGSGGNGENQEHNIQSAEVSKDEQAIPIYRDDREKMPQEASIVEQPRTNQQLAGWSNQLPKAEVLKNNSQFVLECLVVAELFKASAEQQDADAQLKQTTINLASRYAVYGDQIFNNTLELKPAVEDITHKFTGLDKDVQVLFWQRCEQWQP